MTRNTNDTVRAVVLAALMVLSVAGGSIAFAGSAGAAHDAGGLHVESSADGVDTDGNTGTDENTDNDDVYGTVQGAVDAAAAGATIQVAAGTYQEAVTVSTADLTLEGAQAGVDPTDGRTGDESIVEASGGTAFSIEASGVTVDGFTLQNSVTGIDTAEANAGYTLRNNIIADNERGIMLETSGTSPTVVEHNYLADNDQGSSAVGLVSGYGGSSGDANNVDILDNTFTGHTEGGPSYALQLFAGVSGDGTGHSDVEISNNEFGASLIINEVDGITISGNTVDLSGDTDSSTGIYFGGDVLDAIVTDNTVTNAPDVGIRITETFAGDNGAFTITGNTLGDNPTDVVVTAAAADGTALSINGATDTDEQIEALYGDNIDVNTVEVGGSTAPAVEVTATPTEATSEANYDVTFTSNNPAYAATTMTLDLSSIGTDVSGVSASDLSLTIDGQATTINGISNPSADAVRVDFATTTVNPGDVIQLTSSNYAFQNPGSTGTWSASVSVSSVDTTIETGTDSVEITEDTIPEIDSVDVENAPISQADAGVEQTVTVEFSELMDTSTSANPTVEVTGLASSPIAVSGAFVDQTTWEGTVTIPDEDEDTTATVDVSGAQDDEGNALQGQTAFDVLVDTDAPVIAVDAPSEPISGDYDLTQIFSLTASAADSDWTFEYSTDGGDTWESTDSTLDTTTLADGEVVLSATAEDDVGNSDTAETTVSVDNPPSELGLVLDLPTDGGITVGVTSDEELEAIDLDVLAQKTLPSETENLGGAPSDTLSREDFTETVREDGTYEYTTTWTAPRDGVFDFTLDSVTDTGNNQITETNLNSQGDQVLDWTFDTSAPTVSNAFIESATAAETVIEIRFSEPVDFSQGIGTDDVSIDGVADADITALTPGPEDDAFTVTVDGHVSTGDDPMITVEGGSVVFEESGAGETQTDGTEAPEGGLSTVVHTTHLTLSAGQNFVSVPAETGSVAISELDTSDVNTIWTYDDGQWQSTVPGGPSELQDFTSLRGGQGYIFVMNSQASIDANVQNTLSSSGGQPTLPGQVQLEEGWNLVGHWQEGTQPRSTALGSISDDVFQVYGQGSGGGFESIAPGDDMEAGESYWVFVTEDTVYGPADWQLPQAL